MIARRIAWMKLGAMISALAFSACSGSPPGGTAEPGEGEATEADDAVKCGHFSLKAAPQDQTVFGGGCAHYTIETAVTAEPDTVIQLSASEGTLSPQKVKAGGTSTLTVCTAPCSGDAEGSIDQVTVTGTTPCETRSVTVGLTIRCFPCEGADCCVGGCCPGQDDEACPHILQAQ